jgi:hypothetical protein
MIARLVFNDDAGRRRLNAATHLPVAMEIVRQLISCWLRMRLVVVRTRRGRCSMAAQALTTAQSCDL